MNDGNWQFQREQDLEAFVWTQLLAWLHLQPLIRQCSISGQVCDILAVDAQQQLIVIELKNIADRDVVPQLTRYYHAIITEKPFAAQVNYDLPIRLMAIVPTVHPRNQIDQQYSRLHFEFYTFRIATQVGGFMFELEPVALPQQRQSVPIPPPLQSTLIPVIPVAPDAPAPSSQLVPPPKSLRKLLDALSPQQQDYLLEIRAQILAFDEHLVEVGRTTTTQYGLRKGQDDIYRTKRCAEFLPLAPGVYRPRLLLLLPYPKREFGGPGRTYKPEPVKGLAWATVWQTPLWERSAELKLLFYLGSSRNRYSSSYSLTQYGSLYRQLTGHDRAFTSIADLVALALAEWQLEVGARVT